MILHDKNKSWAPPNGYTLKKVVGEGAYLRITYIIHEENGEQHVYRTLDIYVNDTGREVMRVADTVVGYTIKSTTPPVSVSRWFRFKNGFLLALQGIQEMFKCPR